MSEQNESPCLRCRTDCKPIANLVSSQEPKSFICVGYNDRSTRQVEQDRFSLCWVNDQIDEHGHWDRRDLIDTMSVISQALSIDENIRVSRGVSDDDMNKTDFK